MGSSIKAQVPISLNGGIGLSTAKEFGSWEPSYGLLIKANGAVRFKNLELELSYARTIHGGGYRSGVSGGTIGNEYELVNTIREMTFQNFISLDLHAKYYLSLFDFKYFLGLGAGYNLLGERMKIQFLNDLIEVPGVFERESFLSGGFKFGIPIGNFEFSYSCQYRYLRKTFKTGFAGQNSYQSFNLNYKFNTKSSSKSTQLKNIIFGNLIARVGIGISHFIPLDPNAALDQGIALSIERGLLNEVNLGFSFEYAWSRGEGFDIAEFETIKEPFEGYPGVRGQRKIKNIYGLKLHVDGIRSINKKILLVYGLGVGYLSNIKDRSLGFIFRSGLRSQFTSHNLELNVPFNSLPAYVSFQNLVSINFRKINDKEKGKI